MATLKISDLSVGDWVSFDTVHLTVEGDDIATAFVKKVQQPARIKSILGDQDLIFAEVDAEDGLGTIYLKMEHIRLIPITAEILKKAGFEASPDLFTAYHADKVWISYDMLSETWGVTIYINDVMSTLYVKILHVHQLQHALRLAGVDKEINL